MSGSPSLGPSRLPHPIRVMCVEDNQFVAHAIGRRVASDPDLEWLGCTCDEAGTLRLAEAARPHVICMDLELPGVDTFGLLAALQQRFPESRVLILSGYVSLELINAAMDAGVWGYLSKGEEPASIFTAIRRVAGGEFVVGKVARMESGNISPASPCIPSPRPPLPAALEKQLQERIRPLNRFMGPFGSRNQTS